MEELGRFGDAGDVWIKEAKSKLNSNSPDDRFPDSQFQWAAENFDRDPSRTSDALQARKNAASLYLKHAEYYAGKGKYQIASVLSQNAAKIFKHYDTTKKDLNDISSAEEAYLQSNRYQETALLRGEQFSNISTVAWNNLYGLAYLFKGKDASKAKRYATETISLVKRSPPPLGVVGNGGFLTGAGFIFEQEGELNSALKAYELGLEYTDISRNTENYKRPIAIAEKLGRTDLAKQWGAELAAIEKIEGQTHPGQPWFVANGKSAQELEREAEKRRLQSVAYKSIGQNRLAALRQTMVADLLEKSRLARNEANEKAVRDSELAEQARRDEIEEKARREKSNREFAMAIGAATTMLASTQQMKNRSQQSSPTTNYVAPSTSRYEPSPTLSNRAGSAIPTPMPETSPQINVGNASQARGIGSGNSKLQSKDATHCVEIIPKDFKGCQYKRCIHNACGLEKISVWWDGGMVDIAPGRNWPVNAMADNGGPVRYKACAWDKRAGYSPHPDPCRY